MTKLTPRSDQYFYVTDHPILKDAEVVKAEDYDRLKAELAAAQAKIDRLMLEYCPEEMTKAQVENWAAHQKAVEPK